MNYQRNDRTSVKCPLLEVTCLEYKIDEIRDYLNGKFLQNMHQEVKNNNNNKTKHVSNTVS